MYKNNNNYNIPHRRGDLRSPEVSNNTKARNGRTQFAPTIVCIEIINKAFSLGKFPRLTGEMSLRDIFTSFWKRFLIKKSTAGFPTVDSIRLFILIYYTFRKYHLRSIQSDCVS